MARMPRARVTVVASQSVTIVTFRRRDGAAIDAETAEPRRSCDKIFGVIIRARRVASALAHVLFWVAAVASPAAAHSVPTRFEPGRDATVRSAPREVRILFGGDIEPAFSSIEVKDAAGRRVDKGDARPDERRQRLLRVGLHPLGPGVYRVSWQILAVDGHRNEGTYVFTVTLPD